ncbi:MAG: domain protein beta Propeller [Bryobacterales bacterium]|nr:domain protein beta Propeller [Bryobacterales bacterium]
MVDGFTRRAFLAGLASTGLVCGQRTRKPREIPRVGEFVRYVDPVTENALVRLTALSSANRLPAPQNAFVSARSRFLVFSSDRTGVPAPHLVDLRSGAIRQLAESAALNSQSLSLDRAERSLFFLDGDKLQQVQIVNGRATTLAEGVSAFAGRSEAEMLVVRGGRLQRAADGQTLASDLASGPCLVSPDGALCLFNKTSGAESELWCLPLRTPGNARRLAAGPIRFPYWSPDSQSVLFLRDVAGSGVTLSEIHRVSKEGTAEERVTGTSQFAAFAPNSDASVFVGASRSKAQPTVDLLLGASKRELTLCEHHATNADTVTPVFAPDSRRVYFQSDREGKPALYSINVELLVEPTLS